MLRTRMAGGVGAGGVNAPGYPIRGSLSTGRCRPLNTEAIQFLFRHDKHFSFRHAPKFVHSILVDSDTA